MRVVALTRPRRSTGVCVWRTVVTTTVSRPTAYPLTAKAAPRAVISADTPHPGTAAGRTKRTRGSTAAVMTIVGDERRTGVALAAVRGVDAVAHLDHADRVRRTVEACATDQQLVLDVVDDTGDSSRDAGIGRDLPTPPGHVPTHSGPTTYGVSVIGPPGSRRRDRLWPARGSPRARARRARPRARFARPRSSHLPLSSAAARPACPPGHRHCPQARARAS